MLRIGPVLMALFEDNKCMVNDTTDMILCLQQIDFGNAWDAYNRLDGASSTLTHLFVAKIDILYQDVSHPYILI